MGLRETFYNWAKQYDVPEILSEQAQAGQGHKSKTWQADQWMESFPGGIPMDTPIGSGHMDLFNWFVAVAEGLGINLNAPEVGNQWGDQQIDWTQYGFSPYVNFLFSVINSLIDGQWNSTGVNTIIGLWGTGGMLPPEVPSKYTTSISSTGKPARSGPVIGGWPSLGPHGGPSAPG